MAFFAVENRWQRLETGYFGVRSVFHHFSDTARDQLVVLSCGHARPEFL